MAQLNPKSTGGGINEHPIYELMEKAEEKWETLLSQQSRTLPAAVEAYKRKYHIDPPLGFDQWFAFCQQNNVTIVDDFDQLMKDILPHYALKPETFIKRSQALEGTAFTYALDVRKDKIDLTGERAWSARPRHIQGLIDGFKGALPDGFSLKVIGSDHDTGSTILGSDQRDRAMQLVKEGKCR
jgi:hypothetical protein